MKGKKAKMGRPPKDVKDKLSEVVTLRMNPADHKRLKRDARASGLSLSAYLQMCWQKQKEGH